MIDHDRQSVFHLLLAGHSIIRIYLFICEQGTVKAAPAASPSCQYFCYCFASMTTMINALSSQFDQICQVLSCDGFKKRKKYHSNKNDLDFFSLDLFLCTFKASINDITNCNFLDHLNHCVVMKNVNICEWFISYQFIQ